MNSQLQFDNSYRKLGDQFFDPQAPTPVAKPELIRVNHSLAQTLDIDPNWLSSEAGVSALAGNTIPSGAEPIATVYAGHQFGNWNPRLGDGRAVLLGELTTDNGERFDLQLKGSGATLYSRGGDGRAPLGPVIREYLISEAMFALGVPTSRSLAAVTTGESVMREQVEPGAVLTRVASSHIRFGTFQYFMSQNDLGSVKTLADYVIQRHFPELAGSQTPYLDLFRAVIGRTAHLVSQWQQLGFIHGVMNTDNMLVCGETIDYGPCAFMDVYHPETVFSSIDVAGRYAYQNQPGIAHWNLAALAQCLTGLIDEDEDAGRQAAKDELDQFPQRFYEHHRTGMAHKVGIQDPTDSSDELLRDLLSVMADEQLDYTNTFTNLRLSLTTEISLPEPLKAWREQWLEHIEDQEAAALLMKQANPVIIPRNHQVERAIQAAMSGSFESFHKLTEALAQPFDDAWLDTNYALPPEEAEKVQRTFCGT